MTNSRKKLSKHKPHGFGAKNINLELRRAENHLFNEDWVGACKILNPLSEQFPHNRLVWEYLRDASFESRDMRLYQKACMRLFQLRPNSDDATYALGGAYLNNHHPVLALQTLRIALELNPDHEFAPKSRNYVEALEPVVQELLDTLDFSDDEGLEITALHELGQAYLEQGDFALARKTEEEVLQRYPNFTAALNNLSLIAWVENDEVSAISTAQAVLDSESDNIHALANLIKFHMLSGNSEAATAYGEQLKASQSDAWDGWTKKIEGLTYLADDVGIVDFFDQATDKNSVGSSLNANFYHWAAVALARTGDRKRAIAQWEKASQINPSFILAKENLEDIQNGVGQRHGAWPFNWQDWFKPKSVLAIRKAIEQSQSSGKSGNLQLTLKNFLAEHPDVMSILPIILERGGPKGQDFVLSTAENLKTPDLLAMIADFALSQNGSDKWRNRAAALAIEHNFLSRHINRLWLNGEWREIMTLAYKFHNESLANHAKEIETCLKETLHILQTSDEGEANEVKSILNNALEEEFDTPNLLINLAEEYINQNLQEEGFHLIFDIANRFPDSVFAGVATAKLFIAKGDLEAAEIVLNPFIERERFHFMEFRAFCDAHVELLVAQKKLDVARSWLGLWEKVNPGNPNLEYWKKYLSPGRIKLPKLWH